MYFRLIFLRMKKKHNFLSSYKGVDVYHQGKNIRNLILDKYLQVKRDLHVAVTA